MYSRLEIIKINLIPLRRPPKKRDVGKKREEEDIGHTRVVPRVVNEKGEHQNNTLSSLKLKRSLEILLGATMEMGAQPKRRERVRCRHRAEESSESADTQEQTAQLKKMDGGGINRSALEKKWGLGNGKSS